MRPIQPGQRLHRRDARQTFIDIHAAQQWLIKPRLKFIGDQQDLIVVRGKGFANVAPVWTPAYMACSSAIHRE